MNESKGIVNQLRDRDLTHDTLEPAMSNFVALLVEDDAFLRETMAEALKAENYAVVECSTAEAAELVVASTGNELKALITDHNLAGKMTGVELASYARNRYPALNIIVISGRMVPPLPANVLFLQKPFLPSALLGVM
jgi:CheY-like chemotaxis protein